MKKAIKKKLWRVQDLIGQAKGGYMNDRVSNRADNVMKPLNEAFALMVEVNSELGPPQKEKL